MFILSIFILFFFFFNDTATTEIYTLSLHDALPIWTFDVESDVPWDEMGTWQRRSLNTTGPLTERAATRSEEHTSELQSQSNLVCRLLLEKKKNKYKEIVIQTPTWLEYYELSTLCRS